MSDAVTRNTASVIVAPNVEQTGKGELQPPWPEDFFSARRTVDYSDDYLAHWFAVAHRGLFRFVPQRSSWIAWNGVCWKMDAYLEVMDAIRKSIRGVTVGGDIARSQVTAAQVSAVEKLCRSDPLFVTSADLLDADPWILNTPTGIIDLRSGQLLPSNPDRLCTKVTLATWNPEEGVDIFNQTLDEIVQGDQEKKLHLQRFFGYAATGATSEHVMLIIHGEGSNGKNTIVETIAKVMGSYSVNFSPEVLLVSKGERHQTEIAQFDGVRLAYSGEPPSKGSILNDSRVKVMTGDEMLSARRMRQDQTQFRRSHKMVMYCNHLPRLTDVSFGMRRRLHVVRLGATFPQLPGESKGEMLVRMCGGAILAWLVQGALEWQKRGTAPPASVMAQSNAYVDDHDTVAVWAKERCTKRAGGFTSSLCPIHRLQQLLPPDGRGSDHGHGLLPEARSILREGSDE